MTPDPIGKDHAMFRDLSGWHVLILVGVVVLLFGARKLPDGARALGRSLRIFKSEVKGLVEDDHDPEADQARSAQPAAVTAGPVPTASEVPVPEPLPVTAQAAPVGTQPAAGPPAG